MIDTTKPGQIILLIGAPRAGKSSIIEVVKETWSPAWMNLGLDSFWFSVWGEELTGPGVHSHLFLEQIVPPVSDPDRYGQIRGSLYSAMTVGMFQSIAAHARAGLNVVADVVPLVDDFFREPASCLSELPVLLVGVRCPVETIMERRIAGHEPKRDRILSKISKGDPIPEVVLRWQRVSHVPGTYDLEVDTSKLSPEECAGIIREYLDDGKPQTAMQQFARQLGVVVESHSE